VGQAATEAFVYSFIAILFLDFTVGIFWNAVYRSLWPQAAGLI
jgi:phospholipid/cholesterol/gamma-HCH transport system permease protein